ncbi:unnamed protein product [Sympodiomycopsis kandeliae]
MAIVRLAVPTIAGATFSLSLLYLYHTSLVTHQLDIEKHLLSSSDALRKLQDKRDRLVRGPEEQNDEVVKEGLVKSRFQPDRYSSLGDEIRSKWNRTLIALTETASTTQYDQVLGKTISSLSNLTSNLLNSSSSSSSSSSILNTTPTNSLSLASSNQVSSLTSTLPSVSSSSSSRVGGVIYSSDAKHTLSLRSPDEKILKAMEVTEGTVPGVSNARLA